MKVSLLRLLCVMTLFFGAILWGQNANGNFTGKVTASNGAPIPNVTVTVTNLSTNASQKVLTGPDGSFAVAGLAPGNYRVDVEAAGYTRTTQDNIQFTTNTRTNLAITLQAGNSSEAAHATGEASTLQSSGGEVDTTIGERTINELPVIDRNAQQLVGLASGITPPQPALDILRDPERNRFFSAIGQAPTVNSWQADGLYNTEPFRNTSVRVITDTSQSQMHVETANQIVESGFNGGAFINQVSRQGSNDVHGDLFEFWSGDILRARNYFNNYPGSSNPRFVYNQFGGDLGAPIVHDKTFFFGAYQGTFQNGGLSQLTTVPTAAALRGNFAGIPGLSIYNPNSGLATGFGRTPFPGGIIPSSQINPAAAAIASYIPSPNLAGYFDNYAANVPFRNDGNKADGRIDQQIGDHTSAFLRYGYTNDWNTMGSPLGSVIGAAERDRIVAQNAMMGIDHISGRLITDLRFGYNRFDQKLNSAANENPLASQLGLSGFSNNLVGINIPGLAPIGAPSYLPEHAVDNTFNWVWNWSLHTSHNDLRWGTDIRRIRSDGFTDTMFGSIFGPNGTAYFGPGATMLNAASPSPISQYGEFYNAYAAFLTGSPSQFGVSNYLTTPTLRQSEYALWIGDRVRPFSRLTLDFGVRYEVYSPLEPRGVGGASFLNTLTNTYNYSGVGGVGNHWNYYDLDNVAPRLGFALQATNRTVIRGGYGMNYFQEPYMYSGFMAPTYGFASGVQGTYGVASLNRPFGAVAVNSVQAPNTLQNGAPAGNLPAGLFPRRLDTPYVQTFSLQVQQDFYWGTMLSLGYVGSLGRHLPAIEELNAAAAGTGVAGLPFFSVGRTASTLFYNNALTNNYNSLQVSLSKRFSHGLSFLGSYTWSKALGYTSSNDVLFNPSNLRANYGPLDYDRQHVLTISHVWEIPWGTHGNNMMQTILGGWQLNGVFTWATGTPLTITTDSLACACPGNTSFANLTSGVNPINANGANYLNTAAFSTPLAGTTGNLGRGAIYGPGYRNYDMSLFKNFHVRDRFNLQLRGEVYNLTNTPRFLNPVTNINSPDFGQMVGTVNGAFGRQVNLGARVTF